MVETGDVFYPLAAMQPKRVASSAKTVLSPTCVGQPRAVEIACVDLGGLRRLLDYQLTRR